MLLQGGIQFRISRVCPGGQYAVEVFLDHRNGPADQVAQVVCQICVHPGQEGFVGVVSVGTEGHFPHQVIAERIHAVTCNDGAGINHIALGFAHPVSAEQQPAVAEHLFRQRQAQGMQHNRPVNRMEAHDLLTHQVDIRRPVFAVKLVVFRSVAQSGNIIAQRVNPDIYGVLVVKVHRNAPFDAGPAHAQILEAGTQEVGQHLVSPFCRLDKVRMGLNIVDQPVLVFAHFEEIAFFLHGLAGPSAVRADFHAVLFHQLGGRPETFTGRTVHSFILRLVNISLFIELAEDFLHNFDMPLLGGADKVVVLNVHEFPQILRLSHDFIHIFNGRYTGFCCLLLNLLAVFVRTGQKIRVIALHLLEPGHGIGCHGCVGVADGHVAGRIINRRSDVEGLFALTHGSFLQLLVKRAVATQQP